MIRLARIVIVLFTALIVPTAATAQPAVDTELDRRVQAFLAERQGTWRDLNVPEVDGRTLYELIVANGFRNAVEIGTSTGHSAIWIGWALGRTGGRLTTIEIDPRRHGIAVENFATAGLDHVIDARLANAHDLVPQLEGPIDFVFSDADKDWYTNYFDALWPKIVPGGCFTAHNVSMNQLGIREFLDHVRSVPDAVTTIDTRSRAGLSITCKRQP
ncbi:methyltransferase [Pseudothauera nasutitermitis]|uniref:Methyltransferase n=1 Tax=Pseudothauera nasutitermitis TaxID=2565930 RepID=A0A4S4AZN4_9RHOO|nr:class I SAM-dependent methyltransferase [Pseudothauera nasutitermitis]THF65649.1 methyltransferase [Pseudothauera nasutitermitis]